MRRLLLSAFSVVVLFASSAPAAIDPVAADHYSMIAAQYDHRVDREGAAYFRALSRGEDRTAPTIEASDRAAHPDLAEFYDAQSDIIRRGRAYARRVNDPIFAQRVEIGAAHIDAMRYELSKGRSASRDALWMHLRESRSWICVHHLPNDAPEPPATIKATLEANPERITLGACTMLHWTSENATTVRIEPGLGRVSANGTREVCPRENTTYRIIAEGPAGTVEKTDFVEVVAPAPAPAPLPESLGMIHFDFDLWDIRSDAVENIAKVADFMRRNPEIRVSVEGHTDAKASEAYNIPLSNRRAEAARDYLIERYGISANRLPTVGLGKSRYIADNERNGEDYPEGRARNRRVEFRVLRSL